MNGKGDRNRVSNMQAFADNWNKIFQRRDGNTTTFRCGCEEIDHADGVSVNHCKYHLHGNGQLSWENDPED